MTRKVIQQAPVYQCQLENGSWIDQSKESYEDYNKMGQFVVRVLYATIEQPVEIPVDHDFAIGTATHEDALRFADAIDPFVRKKAPDHLTMSCAAKTLRDLAQIVQTPSSIEQKTHSEPVEGQLPAIEFQNRVAPWMQVCFGPEISSNSMELNHKFFEESTKLVQVNGMTRNKAHQLVDYTFDRPVGELQQEVGGVMVTLAALCFAAGLDMHATGETELARIWKKIEKIRKKQATKPKHSPIPEMPAIPETSNTLLKNKLSKSLLIEDYGIPIEKSDWPEILLKTSKLKPVSTGQGTHCCDETFFVDGCTVSVVYDYKDQAEPIEIIRYKTKPEVGKP